MDPINYVPCIKTATDLCILEQGALAKMQEEEKVPGNVLVKLCWFSWAPATVLFGPLWRVVFPNDWATEYYHVIKGKGASPYDTHKTMLTFRIQIDRGQHPVDFIQQGSTGPRMVCEAGRKVNEPRQLMLGLIDTIRQVLMGLRPLGSSPSA